MWEELSEEHAFNNMHMYMYPGHCAMLSCGVWCCRLPLQSQLALAYSQSASLLCLGAARGQWLSDVLAAKLDAQGTLQSEQAQVKQGRQGA